VALRLGKARNGTGPRLEEVRTSEILAHQLQHTIIIQMRIMGDDVTRMGSKEVGIVRNKGRRFLATYRSKSLVLGELQNVVSSAFLECWRRLLQCGGR
jgi:hypothetical protein